MESRKKRISLGALAVGTLGITSIALADSVTFNVDLGPCGQQSITCTSSAGQSCGYNKGYTVDNGNCSSWYVTCACS
jgi:hypothetical protein